jgi:PII-like signaling protein
MNGYQITFYMEQDQRHHGHPLGQWLIDLARELHLHGATVRADVEGFGRSGRIHSAHFVELADRPMEFVTVVTEEEAARLFARLRTESVKLFYVKAPVEFGTLPE